MNIKQIMQILMMIGLLAMSIICINQAKADDWVAVATSKRDLFHEKCHVVFGDAHTQHFVQMQLKRDFPIFTPKEVNKKNCRRYGVAANEPLKNRILVLAKRVSIVRIGKLCAKTDTDLNDGRFDLIIHGCAIPLERYNRKIEQGV